LRGDSTKVLILLVLPVSTHGVCSLFLLLNGQVGPLKIFNVNDVLDALATMGTDVLGFRVLDVLVVLDGEILSFDLLFEFFSLAVASN
jgi:hypothetical protein